MIFQISINDIPAKDGELSFPEMSLSSARALGTKCRFRFSMPVPDFVGKYSGSWENTAIDLRDDDQITGEKDELGFANYPPLQEIVGDAVLLKMAVIPFLYKEIFQDYLSLPKQGQRACYIDSVNTAFVTNNCLVLEGDAYAFE